MSDRRAGAPSHAPALMFAVGMLGLAVALVASMAGWQGERRKNEALTVVMSRQIDTLRMRLADLGDTTRSGRHIRFLQGQVAELRNGLDSEAIQTLKQAGLADPVNDIKASLVRQHQLLPSFSDSNRRVAFYGADYGRILNQRWAMAPWSNGLHRGWILLEYRIEGTRITWKRLALYEP